MSQKSEILKHLEAGNTITPFEALKLYSCFRLGGVIFRLKDEGYNITTKLVSNHSGNPYARYELVGG